LVFDGWSREEWWLRAKAVVLRWGSKDAVNFVEGRLNAGLGLAVLGAG
jgi:hypothetical protein